MKAISLAMVMAVSACGRSADDGAPRGDHLGKDQPSENLPGPKLRERLDGLADCWTKLGAPSGGREWRRNGGLCNRTFHREGSSGELTLSMVFPNGPRGPIDVTEGYARFEARREQVGVDLLVRIPASSDLRANAKLEILRNDVRVASVDLPRGDSSVLASPTALEQALNAVIDAEHDPASKDLSKRQECRLLPTPSDLKPGETNGAQQCEWVPTTQTERDSMSKEILAEGGAARAWLTRNRDLVHALTNELFPFDDTGCASLATGR